MSGESDDSVPASLLKQGFTSSSDEEDGARVVRGKGGDSDVPALLLTVTGCFRDDSDPALTRGFASSSDDKEGGCVVE